MNKKLFVGIAFATILLMMTFVTCAPRDQATEPIKIGCTFPLTGEVASAGKRIQNGLLLALDDLNEKGILGRKLEIILEDDQNKPAMAAGNMKKFVHIDKVHAVIGSAASGCTLAMVPIANESKVVVLSPISSSASLTKEGGPFFFRICPADNFQAREAASWIVKQAPKKVAIIYVNNDWGKSLSVDVQAVLQKKGIQIALVEGIAENQKDLRTVCAKVASSKAEILYAPTYPVDGGTLVKQAKEIGLSMSLLGGDNWDSPEFRTIAGEAANGCFFIKAIEPRGKLYADFLDAYKRRYGDDPDAFATWSYDALKVIAQALNGSNGRGGEYLVEALHKIDMEGASGKIAFDKNGDLSYPRFGVFTYINNKVVPVRGGSK